MSDGVFKEEVAKAVESAIIDKVVASKAMEYLEKGIYWEVAKTAGCYYNLEGTTENTIQACRKIVDKIREFQGCKAKESTAETTVVFGTSGWRGIIGEDFTTLNVAKVVRGIIEMMQTAEFLKVNNYSSFEEVKKNGVIVFRDNRFMGDEFIAIAS